MSERLLVPKRTGRRIDGGKGPWRSKAYRDSVKAHPCLVCSGQAQEAHHIRETLPRTMGRRVGDEWCVPMCRRCHAILHNASRNYWGLMQIDPQNWAVVHRHESPIWQAHLRRQAGLCPCT